MTRSRPNAWPPKAPGAQARPVLVSRVTRSLSIVWVGYIVLDRAEPFGMWRQRCAVRKLDREAARWEREADAAGSRYFSAMEGLEHIERGRMGQRAQLERDIEGFVQLGVLPP